MASDLFLILDDSSTDFYYTGEWLINNASQWYGGSCHSLNNGNGKGSLTVSFEGVSIAFYGTTPSSSMSTGVSVSIDGKPPSTFIYGALLNTAYRQWYQSPDLPNGPHNVTLNVVDGTSLDFAIVVPGLNIPVKDRTVIVDDDSLAVKYSGGWRRSLNGIESSKIQGVPFRNSTHQTWSAGDSLSLSFTGTFVSVYGIFPWRNLGSISATYTVDGISQQKLYSVTVNSPEYVNQVGQVPNFVLYTSGHLASGKHTLNINITQSMNQSFILDYFTYLPSFTYPSQTRNSSFTASMTILSTIPPAVVKTSSSTIASLVDNKDTDRSFATGRVIGGVLGGVLLLAFGCFLGYYIRRRRVEHHFRRLDTKAGEYSLRLLVKDSLPGPIVLRPTSGLSHHSVSPYPFFLAPNRLAHSAEPLVRQSWPPERINEAQDVPSSESISHIKPQNLENSSVAQFNLQSEPQRQINEVRHVHSISDEQSSHSLTSLEDRRIDTHEGFFDDLFMCERTREQEHWSHSPDPSHILHQMPARPQPRLTPVRRNVVPINENHPNENSCDPQMSTGTIELNYDSTSRQGHSTFSPNIRSWTQSSRLIPLMRRFDDPPLTAPVSVTRSSPIASAFPRLSAIILRHYSRSDIGAPTEGEDSSLEPTRAPPAYDSISPRQDGLVTAPWTTRNRPSA